MALVMATPVDFGPYPWMKFALQEYGQKERAGKSTNNPRILLYHSLVGKAKDDETPWCSAFTNWCMKQAGIQGTGKANARSWLSWGDHCLSGPVFGAVAVFTRPPKVWQGHVAFFVGRAKGKILVLGGNQSNSVCINPYPESRLLGYRWPKGLSLPTDVDASGLLDSFSGLSRELDAPA